MRVIRMHQYGGPEVLKIEEMECPQPGPGEVLLQVDVIGMNYADTLHRRGLYPEAAALPRVPGADVVGHVIKVGAEVTTVTPGMPAMALVQENGYAEYVIVAEHQVLPLPEQMPPAEAVAFALQGQVAYHLLVTAACLQAGESVLVQAAAGGVGSLSLQLAKALGLDRLLPQPVAAQSSILHARWALIFVLITHRLVGQNRCSRLQGAKECRSSWKWWVAQSLPKVSVYWPPLDAWCSLA
jgi:NADPH:quinone reductase